MKRRVAWGIVCLGAMIWILFTPALLCGPIEAQYRDTHFYLMASPSGELRCIQREESGWSDERRFWYVVNLMVPGQILLVMSFAKFFSNNHVSRARWIPSRRDA